MIHTVVSVGIAFFANIAIARVLGVADYGRLAFLGGVLEIAAAVVAMGTASGLVQFGAKAHAAGRTAEVRNLLSRTQGFRLLVAAPLVAVVVVFLASLSVPLLLLTLTFGVFVPAAVGAASDSLTIENKSATGARIAMAAGILTQAVVLASLFFIGTADSVWAARLMLTGTSGIVALWLILPAYRTAILAPALPRGFPDGFWRFALPTGLASVISTLVVSRTEVIALHWLATPAATGTFALAFGLAGHLFSPAQALLGPLIPAVSGLHEVEPGSVSRALERTLRSSSTIVALILAGAVPALAVLVPFIYGIEYAGVPPIVVALGVAGGFIVMTAPVKAFVLARLRGRKMLQASTIALGVDVILVVVLIPTIGVWGAVIANVAAAATQLVVLLASELKALGLGVRSVARSTAPSLVGAIACLTSWTGSSSLPLHPLGAAACAGLTGTVLVFAGLRLTRTGLDLDDAEAILRTLPPRIASAIRPAIMMTAQSRRA